MIMNDNTISDIYLLSDRYNILDPEIEMEKPDASSVWKENTVRYDRFPTLIQSKDIYHIHQTKREKIRSLEDD